MCGIAALFRLRPGTGLESIRAMTDTIRHRGPDDEGFLFISRDGQALALGGKDTPVEVYRAPYRYTPNSPLESPAPDDAFAAFGHRRLSILDLSPAGHQPLCSADGRYWITYNGEIYNYQELRLELEALGHSFVSNSDTEVILVAYAAWGLGCLQRFNGMWAFVIVDLHAKRLIAARDRFGVKPLYYWASPEGLLAFASEIKQFTVLPGWKPTMNGQRVYDFFTWGSQDHTNETMFQGVFQLRGGEVIDLDFDSLSEKPPVYRWYTLKPQQFKGSKEEAADEFRQLLTDSVRLRLRADVDVGSCLSGGLDSSSIVCLVNDLLGELGETDKQKTFSACAHEKRFDEREFIDEVIRTRQIEAHYTYPSLDSLFETLSDLTWHQDEPFGSTSIYAQWHVFKLAAENQVKVMLDGQGADEQLAGYYVFMSTRYGQLFRQLRWRELWSEMDSIKRLHGFGYGHAVRGIARTLIPTSIAQNTFKMLGKSKVIPAWLDIEELQAVPRMLYDAHASLYDQSYAQLTYAKLPRLLHWEDRDSMAHSVESRVPFLDYRLVEFVLGLPDAYKLSEGITKRVLRDGMKGIIPETIRMRMDKRGFETPEEVWLREKQPEAFTKALDEAIEVSHGVLGPQARQELNAIIRGEQAFSFLPWRWISFGAWVKRFGVDLPRGA